MKQFLWQNWLKIAAVTALFVVSFSIAYYFAAFLPALQRQNNLATQRNAAISGNIDAQQKCANRADWFWKNGGYDQNGGQRNFLGTYYNHWNSTLNKCFILVLQSWTIDNDNVQMRTKDLIDAFGGQSYANITIRGEGVGWLTPTAIICSVGGEGSSQSCKTEAEFDNFVKSYMES